MTATALEPLAALTLLLMAAACAPSGQVGYGAADRAAMDALHMDALHAAGLRTAAVPDGPWVTASGAPGAPFRHPVSDRW
jgi:hypothetical protein